MPHHAAPARSVSVRAVSGWNGFSAGNQALWKDIAMRVSLFRSNSLSAFKSVGLLIALTAGLLQLASGCRSDGSSATSMAPTKATNATMDKAAQSQMTPDQAIARLTEGNHRFVAGQSLHRDYPAEVKATAGGQYPFAVIISCLDSRSGPELVFDQGIGDLFVGRVAGNYCPVDLLGSTEFGTKVAGAKLVVVLGHTECGAIKGACDNVELGNLTTVIHALQPAVTEVQESGDRSSKNKKFVRAVTEANVRRTVASIRSNSPILRELEQSGQIKIVGAMLDISSGEVMFLK
jgi:carbonic anhydrase